MKLTKPEQPIGKILQDRKLITKQQLSHALKIQKEQGGRLGDVLVGLGHVNHLKLYSALAEHHQLPFADLFKEKIDTQLLETSERGNYARFNVVPWRVEAGKTVLATSELSDEVLAWAKTKYRDYRFVITSPFDILKVLQDHFYAVDDEHARHALWKERPHESARYLFSMPSVVTMLIVIALMALVVIYPHLAMISMFAVMNFFYAFSLLFKALIFAVGDRSRLTQYAYRRKELEQMNDRDLPVYSILVPLFREDARTIQQLVAAIRNLQYPKAKLDVKLIVEAADVATIEAIKATQCESYFEIIRVPFSYPQTKPKACNYALRFVRGEYVTIYDAEDVPDPYQLKKVIKSFTDAPRGTVCVQAKLNYFNREENLLSKLFSIEYSAWFNFMLIGLDRLQIPIPLGGTSNHFPVKIIRELYAWDPFNVTEDADLGIRLAQRGYNTVIVDSLTMEESPIRLKDWMKQRSRWIKGYMQTYIVHMRKPELLLNYSGIKGFMGFQFFVGVPSFIFVSMLPMITISVIAAFQPHLMPNHLIFIVYSNLFAGIALHFAIAMRVIQFEKWQNMMVSALIFPLYWVLHAFASLKALWQLFLNPHYWEKTEHGITRMAVSETAVAAE
ncbi:MAG: glycosyltransferase [Proteobacteria bacterium]|nr:glycosyltransferase [Pseudomonadota bacterium]